MERVVSGIAPFDRSRTEQHDNAAECDACTVEITMSTFIFRRDVVSLEQHLRVLCNNSESYFQCFLHWIKTADFNTI